jgi:hypothetical protein
MPRIDPTVSREAEQIYKSLPQGERGKYVSDAIIEKHTKNTSYEARLEQLEKEVKALKDRIGGV